MPLICCLAAFLAYICLKHYNPTHQHSDTLSSRYHFLKPDFSEKEKKVGKGSNWSLDCPIWRIVQSGMWSENWTLSLTLTRTLITHLGNICADFLAHWQLLAHPLATAPSMLGSLRTQALRSTSSYAKLVPSSSLSPSLPYNVVAVRWGMWIGLNE